MQLAEDPKLLLCLTLRRSRLDLEKSSCDHPRRPDHFSGPTLPFLIVPPPPHVSPVPLRSLTRATEPAMARRLLAALLAASLLLPLARPEDSSSATTAYDELGLRGFPRGLLPANVRAYTLDAGSGDFAVDLRSSCRIVLPAGSYLATFSDRLIGCLDDCRISGLDGIRVRDFFRWWSITGTARPPFTLWHRAPRRRRAPQRRATFVQATR